MSQRNDLRFRQEFAYPAVVARFGRSGKAVGACVGLFAINLNDSPSQVGVPDFYTIGI
jgi:hypothetical protein